MTSDISSSRIVIRLGWFVRKEEMIFASIMVFSGKKIKQIVTNLMRNSTILGSSELKYDPKAKPSMVYTLFVSPYSLIAIAKGIKKTIRMSPNIKKSINGILLKMRLQILEVKGWLERWVRIEKTLRNLSA